MLNLRLVRSSVCAAGMLRGVGWGPGGGASRDNDELGREWKQEGGRIMLLRRAGDGRGAQGRLQLLLKLTLTWRRLAPGPSAPQPQSTALLFARCAAPTVPRPKPLHLRMQTQSATGTR